MQFNKKMLSVTVVAVMSSFSTYHTYAEETASDGSEKVEKIKVTGSLISRTQIEGPEPVQVISSEEIEASGLTNIGDLLQNVSSIAGAAPNSRVNNGGDGSTRVALRGLESKRTLTLVNGRRFVSSGSGADASIDLGMIPISLIDRVEILKEGASAAYGSDPIAGVVNIILKDSFDGTETKFFTGITDEGDGDKSTLTITTGKSFDKGNFIFSVGAVTEGEIKAGERGFSSADYRWLDGEVIAQGSSAPPWGYLGGLEGSEDPLTFGPGFEDELRPYRGAEDSYNYQPDNYIATPQDRYYANIIGNIELGEWGFLGAVNFNTELSYARRSSTIQLAPEPIFADSRITLSADNFYNPLIGNTLGVPVQDITDWRRRMVDTGPRVLNYDSTTTRAVFALDGFFAGGWDWTAFYNYGSNSAKDSQNSFFVDRIGHAVGPSNGPDTCLDANGNTIVGCAPLNIFDPSQAAIDYITYVKKATGENKQQHAEFNTSGSFGSLPGGAIGAAFGASWRKESGNYRPDPEVSRDPSNDIAGREAGTSGNVTAREIYAEFALPITEIFETKFASRFSSYNLFGDTLNSSIGFVWRPHDEVMFRGTRGQAFRTPNIEELFQGTTVSQEAAVDPRCVDNRPGCDPSIAQFDTNIGGNPDLEPEEANISTFGFVFAPAAVPGLSSSLDFWYYDISKAITNFSVQTILDRCYNDGDQAMCDLIDDPDGTIESVSNALDNFGAVQTNGADLNIQYKKTFPAGQLKLFHDVTYLDRYTLTNADGSMEELAGRYERKPSEAGGNFSRIRSSTNVTWTAEKWAFNYQLRYIRHADEELEDGLDRQISGMMYNDMRFSYNVEPLKTRFSLGVENIFDRDPPLALTGFNANTDERTYDTTGRFIYFEATTRW